MNIPIDIVMALLVITAIIFLLIGACMAPKRTRYIQARFEPDYSGLPELSGESDRYFRHDMSDRPEIHAAGRQ